MNARIARLWPRWRSRRLRIAVYAILLGFLAGFLNPLLPAEDLVINSRAVLMRREAPQDIVVVAIDEQTLAAVGANDVSRAEDAKVLRELLGAGAKRIYFDRFYRFKEEPAKDAQFVKALHDSNGAVYLAASAGVDHEFLAPLKILPNEEFRREANLVALTSLSHPFSLMESMPLRWDTIAGRVPSLSASLSGRTSEPGHPQLLNWFTGTPAGFYRLDYSYDFDSIPTISYLDLLQGRFDPALVKGRDVVIGPTAASYRDVFDVPFVGEVSGVYLHVAAAHTFRKPLLIKLGWLPALLCVSILVIIGIRRRQAYGPYRTVGYVAVLGVAPYVLDRVGVEIEIAPALLTVAIAVIRTRVLERVKQATDTNAASGLPSLQLLKSSAPTGQGSLVALKLRNYGAIVGSFDNAVEAQLANEIARRIGLGETNVTVYHEGDKFLWFSHLKNPVDILENLEGLHRLVRSSLVIEGRDIDLSFNCGVETNGAIATDKRIANALQAVEQAVRGDELVSFHEVGVTDVQWEISLLSALDRAIDNGEVWVAYQPKLDLTLGTMPGAEALVRWTHPERGPISPDQFIRAAEEYHRIDRITGFVLDHAVQTVKQMRQFRPDFSVSVNISAQLLRFAGLPAMIEAALIRHDMAPDCLVLEITETDRLDQSSKTFEMMKRLVDSGLKLSIDDFGTGNATIDYLRIMPAKEVKIDKSFITGMVENPQDKALVQSIIDMAHSLDRQVVAEGVESQQMIEMLDAMGCDMVQGYQVSRPIRAENLAEMLALPALKKTG